MKYAAEVFRNNKFVMSTDEHDNIYAVFNEARQLGGTKRGDLCVKIYNLNGKRKLVSEYTKTMEGAWTTIKS